MNKIYNLSFVDLLPESIKRDATIKSVATSLDTVLQKTSLSVQNLLIYSRLLHTAGVEQANLLPAMQRLIDANGGLKPLSTAELELLAWQFHVDFREVARTDEELAQMVRNSILWHRIKGTPASIKKALGIFGISAELEEHTSGHWASYQLGIDSYFSDDVLLAYTIAKEMQPVRCQLGRIYNPDNDGRIIIHDTQSTWGKYYWEIESGIPVVMPDGETVIVSLGKNTKAKIDCPEIKPLLVQESCHFLKGILRNYWVWDYAYWGETFPQEARIFRTETGKAITIKKLDTKWYIPKSVDFFEQIVWDDDPNKEGSKWGEINFNWGLGAYEWHDAQVWGDFVWGDVVEHGTVYTKKRSLSTTSFAVAQETHSQNQLMAVSYEVANIANAVEPPHTWKREWDERQWQSLGFIIHKTEELF